MGGYAEYALAQAADIQPKPESVTLKKQLHFRLGVLTAWAAVIDTANVQAGQSVLFMVEQAALAICRAAGTLEGRACHHNISAKNVEFVRSLGCGKCD